MTVSALQGLTLAEAVRRQTTAVRRQMLSMYAPYFSLAASCSCFTVKSFKTNKQMASDCGEATTSSAERRSLILATQLMG